MEVPLDRIVGKRPVAEALAAGVPIDRLLVTRQDSPRFADILAAARERGIPVVDRTKSDLDSVADGVAHQGIVAEARPYDYADLSELRRAVASATDEQGRYPPPIVLADGVTDPQNVGSILRAMDGAGAVGLVLGRRRSARVTPAVRKASAGAADHVSVARVTNMSRALDELKQDGFWAVGLADDAELDLYDADLSGRTVLVVGSEGEGMTRLVREHCDLLVRVPMAGRLGSLNVAQATAVVLFERLRRARAEAAQKGQE